MPQHPNRRHRTGWRKVNYFVFMTLFLMAAGCADSSSGTNNDSETADTSSQTGSGHDGDTLAVSDTHTAGDELPSTASQPTDSDAGDTGIPVAGSCAPLEAPTGNVIRVSPDDVGNLQGIVAAATRGDTILFESGTYHLHGAYLWISNPGVTLRSDSGNPEDVILDGNYETTEIITVAASDCTVAELTIQHAATHPIHVTSSDAGNTNHTMIYRVNIVDPGEQAIKINSHNSAMAAYADNGEIACADIALTDAGRPNVNMSATPCYTGGIDAHRARGWTIRDNVISGFWCPNGYSEHAVHFWRGCRDTVVANNILTNNARGVGFGMASSGDARTYSDNPCGLDASAYVGHVGGVIQNNFIHAGDANLFASEGGFDCGVCLWSACDVQVTHNSIVSTDSMFSSIEWRFGSSSAKVANNLVTHQMRARDGATAIQSGNVENVSLSDFVNAAAGDLHLVTGAAAIDAGDGVVENLPASDIDGDLRDATPDAGADEFQ